MRHLKVGKLPSILRQGGFIGLGIRGSGPAFGGGQSGPGAGIRSLFANGEAGAIFIAQKPSEWGANPDLVTMYQDSVGTTPVTALEQPVGLHLDTRPIFKFPDGAPNPAPNAVGQPLRGAQGWSDGGASLLGSATRISPNVYRILSTDGTNSEVLTGAGTALVGVWYEVSFNVDSVTTAGGGVTVDFGGPTIAATVGPKRTTYLCNSNAFGIKRAGGITDVQISGLSFKPVYGNHRSQSSVGARGTLSARYNKVTARNANPVDLTNASLVNAPNALSTLTVVNDAAALAGANLSGICSLGNVYKLDNTAGNGIASVVFQGATGNTNQHAFSAWIRGGTGLLGGVGGSKAAVLASPVYVKNFTSVPVAGTTATLTVQADVGQVLFIILPDLREACYAYLPTPQIILGTGATAADYDDTGFPARIKYSGAQYAVTGSIDLSGTNDVQVFAGLTKLNDAAVNFFLYSSPNFSTNTGAFAVRSPSTVAGANFGVNISGATGNNQVETAAGYPAPTSNVMSTLFSLGAANAGVVRVNGTQAAIGGTSTGAGPFGNYAITYGQSGAGAAPFTGDEFVSIVRGGPLAANDPRIAQAEQFCNNLMSKVY